MEIIEVDQCTDEWFRLRIASIGGSSISKVVAGGQGKMRQGLLYDFVGELLSGEKKAGYRNEHMDAGLEYENDARILYEIETGYEVKQVGLIRNGDYKHYSPDGLVGDDGMLEIKCVIPSVWVERKATGSVPTEYRRQIQWGLSISERTWCDFVNYCPYLKETYPLIIQRIERDEKEIQELQDGADKFINEMLELYQRVK